MSSSRTQYLVVVRTKSCFSVACTSGATSPRRQDQIWDMATTTSE